MLAGNTKQVLKFRDIYKSALTVLELLTVISIMSISLLIFNNINSIARYYYSHKSKIIIAKLNNLITIAKNTALITKQNVTICPYDNITKQCSDNWHNTIIIFYDHNKKTLLTNNLKLSKYEEITLKQFNQKNYISFNRNGENNSNNGTINYSNLYYNYNRQAIINRAGRVRAK